MANILFGDYTATKEEDDGVEDVIIGMFFDGTLNNEGKTYIRKEHENKIKGLPYNKKAADKYPTIKIDADSFDNDYSNVARMYRFYTNGNQKSLYIEGIGTVNGQSSDIPEGYLTGTGISGIDKKVKNGCEEAVKIMPAGKKINLIFDVFGFSRGAAAARYFIHEVTKPKYTPFWGTEMPARGFLGEALVKSNIELVTFKIRFVGLYDTVSSYGYNFNDDVDDLNLDSIKHFSVRNVVQFSAAHEWRTNFNLTNILSAGNRGIEFKIPGAHADVGGCYESATFDQYHNPSVIPARVINDEKEYNILADQKRQPFIDAGWYLKKQLVVGPHSNKYVNHIGLNGSRYIDKKYSYIPLQFMCKLADEKQSKFKMDELKQPKNFQIPQMAKSGEQHILHYVYNRLQKYVDDTKKLSADQRGRVSYKKYLDFTNEKILINGYIHWSATEKTGHGARENNKRKTIDG